MIQKLLFLLKSKLFIAYLLINFQIQEKIINFNNNHNEDEENQLEDYLETLDNELKEDLEKNALLKVK